MLWAIHLIDKPDTKSLRDGNRPAHSAYLKKLDPICFFTGPLQSDDASQIIGSLWIISAQSRAEAEAFLEGEPFYRAGVFERVTISRTFAGHFHPELAK